MPTSTFTIFETKNITSFKPRFNNLITRLGATALKIEDKLTDYPMLYTNEGEAIDVVKKTRLTKKIAEADALRDSTYRGLRATVKGALHHFNPEKKEAANRISILIDHFGNIPAKPNDKETGAITKLIYEFKGQYANDVVALNITDWVEKLEEDNNAFTALKSDLYS